MTLNRWIAILIAFAVLAFPTLSLADHHAAGEAAEEAAEESDAESDEGGEGSEGDDQDESESDD